MRDMLRDYLHIRSLEPEKMAAWVRGQFPSGVRSRWCFAMYDNALTDSFAGNDESPDDIRKRVDLAVALIGLAEESGGVSELSITKWYIRCAMYAVQAGISPVPAVVTPDAIVRRALEFFRLSPAQAARTAENRRKELIDALRTTPFENDLALPEKAGYRELAAIISLLGDLAWFRGKVMDEGQAGQLQAWLDVRDQLRPGPVVAQYSNARMQARMHAD